MSNSDNAQSNTGKVVKYRKPLNFNLGIIVFGLLFVYIVIRIYTSFQDESIAGYEVKAGSLAVSTNFNALALRTEKIVTSNYTGYANFYVAEGERINSGGLVYSIDENNQLKNYLSDPANAVSISSEEREEVSESLRYSLKTRDDHSFTSFYSLVTDVSSILKKYDNYNIISYMDIISQSKTGANFHMGYANASGIVSFTMDGFEDLTIEDLKAEWFEEDTYSKTVTINENLITQGDPVYKLSMDEEWTLIIPLTTDQVNSFLDQSSVKVTFLKDQTTSVGDFEILQKTDGAYGIITLHDSMCNFVSERFIPIEINTTEETGLKIPVTSIVEKEFYMIPIDYITKGGKNSHEGVNRLTYDEKGNMVADFVEVTIYAKTDTEYYIDETTLRMGDIILLNDSADTVTIQKTGTLIGVYNINKGYADFRQISILYQNDEYAIVKSNTAYGLIAYDYIVLDASTVDEDDFVY